MAAIMPHPAAVRCIANRIAAEQQARGGPISLRPTAEPVHPTQRLRRQADLR